MNNVDAQLDLTARMMIGLFADNIDQRRTRADTQLPGDRVNRFPKPLLGGHSALARELF